MINKAILVGRLGKDPEFRTAQSGRGVCRFTLATDSGFGQSRKTDWHTIVCFDKQADFARDYLKKGNLVYIEGRISYSEYEKDGVKRYSTEIMANTVQSLGSRSDSQNTGGSFDPNRYDAPSGAQNNAYGAPASASSASSAASDLGADIDDGGEYPF